MVHTRIPVTSVVDWYSLISWPLLWVTFALSPRRCVLREREGGCTRSPPPPHHFFHHGPPIHHYPSLPRHQFLPTCTSTGQRLAWATNFRGCGLLMEDFWGFFLVVCVQSCDKDSLCSVLFCCTFWDKLVYLKWVKDAFGILSVFPCRETVLFQRASFDLMLIPLKYVSYIGSCPLYIDRDCPFSERQLKWLQCDLWSTHFVPLYYIERL